MKKNFLLSTFVIFILLAFSASSYAQDNSIAKYWIIFKDKGVYKPDMIIEKESDAYNEGLSLLSDRAIQRRLKVLDENKLIDYADLPVNEVYIQNIKNLNIDIIAKSRWLNGVSAYLTEELVSNVLKTDYVDYLRIVDRMIRLENNEDSFEGNFKVKPNSSEQKINPTKNTYNYGESLEQMEIVNVPSLHNLNITGDGVLIANFDGGFYWREHEATKNMKVIDEYDFINKDTKAYNESNQKYYDRTDQASHGTSTLSAVGGFKSGKLISPAFNSEYIVCKTEYVPTETPMEEDFWLEAAEWVEQKGADIITSSLAYKIFDEPYSKNTYNYEDMNGKTAITSITATRCAYLGMVVVNAMGNNRQTAIPSVTSPGDADSIITVGAINNMKKIAGFSSNGPTSDGRTKPDVVAPGVGVFVAVSKFETENDSTYSFANGTSFSTPITAGIVALILSTHPELTPIQIRDALRNTASQSNNPDNIFGWGIINAYEAALYWGMIWSNKPEVSVTENDITIQIGLASRELINQEKVKITYTTDDRETKEEANLILIKDNNDGNKSGIYSVKLSGIPENTKLKYYFSAEDYQGNLSTFPRSRENSEIFFEFIK